MVEPTEDTPQEREDKATALEEETIDKAEILAKELRDFRTETRRFYVVVLLFLALSVLWEHAW